MSAEAFSAACCHWPTAYGRLESGRFDAGNRMSSSMMVGQALDRHCGLLKELRLFQTQSRARVECRLPRHTRASCRMLQPLTSVRICLPRETHAILPFPSWRWDLALLMSRRLYFPHLPHLRLVGSVPSTLGRTRDAQASYMSLVGNWEDNKHKELCWHLCDPTCLLIQGAV